jgi:mono/diheme cytochrome c family protein
VRRVLISAGVLWTAAAILGAQGPTTSAVRPATPSGQNSSAQNSVSKAPVNGVQAPAGATRATATLPATTTARASNPAEVDKHKAWVKQYCVACHNTRNPLPANDPVNLEKAGLDDVVADAATWERVLRKLNVRAMPPQGMPHPTEASYTEFVGWLTTSLDRGWQGKATPGRYVVHRLNRVEYRNAIRDLLALDVDVSSLLPNDGGNFGFDNIAAALTTSPLLLDGYVTAAQRISTLAVGDPKVQPGTSEYAITRNFSQNTRIEGLPLGTRGGRLVRHVFPADGEYRLLGRLYRGIEEGYAGVEGNDVPNTFIITIDGDEVYRADIGGPEDHAAQAKSMNDVRPIIDARMTAKVKVTAGPHDVGFTFKEHPSQRQDVWVPSRRDSQEIHFTGGLPKLKTVAIEGPYNVTGVSGTPSRERLFVCTPMAAAEEAACAQRILLTFARRAYRQPVTAADIEAPLTFYADARKNGESFDAGIRAGVARVLVSPSFLYRVERDPAGLRAGASRRVSDVELASRLSFFLWSSIPDQKLMDVAAAGRLRAPGALAAQVTRMIADPRADTLVSNFTGQWLQLRNLESKVQPDILMFPDFDDNIREGFRRETELLFSHILRENKSAMELLSADYTFVDERLARHYGISGVYGNRFRQVKITDPNRFGLLGHGSVLSLTSVATRTSPVYRGKYVLSTFLNTPPPPPLPNVPTLEESNKENAPKTVREQLERHRTPVACAGCHRVIDPPGFALENFNSVGQWRTKGDNGGAIDTGGVLADGVKVDGPVALRNAILARPDAFATVLTERLMTYALGRGIEPQDMPVVRAIVRKAATTNYRLASLVQGIIDSAPFQMRTKLEPAGTSTSVARATATASVEQP